MNSRGGVGGWMGECTTASTTRPALQAGCRSSRERAAAGLPRLDAAKPGRPHLSGRRPGRQPCPAMSPASHTRRNGTHPPAPRLARTHPRPQVLKTKPPTNVSSIFFMCLPDKARNAG